MVDGDTRVPAGHVAVPLVAAAVFELVAWSLFAGVSPQAGWFGHPRLLAAVHALTLGVVALSIVGVGWQLVPVVVARPWGWFYPARVVNLLLVASLPFLLLGFDRPGVAVAAAVPVLAAFGVRALAVGWALRRGPRWVHRAWLLVAELTALVGLACAAGLWFSRSGAELGVDPWAGVHRHAVLLVGGWVGGWMAGVGSLLLPMFAVAREPPAGLLALAGVAWFAGLALGEPMVWALGAGGVGVALGVALATGASAGAPLRQGGAGLLGLLVAVGLLLAGREEGAITVGLVLGLLPLTRGVAQRIVPFLAWTAWLSHAASRAPAARTLLPARGAAVQAVLSTLGGLGFVLGRSGYPPLYLPGLVLLAGGALLHLGVLLVALSRAARARLALQALPGTATPRAP